MPGSAGDRPAARPRTGRQRPGDLERVERIAAGRLLDPDEHQARASVRLGPMPLAALHQLFLARFGRSFPRLVLVRIEEASGGNPFYALEIARDARPVRARS